MGNKIAARQQMRKIDVPVIPGHRRHGQLISSRPEKSPASLGYPLLVKPSGGGGGIGMIDGQ